MKYLKITWVDHFSESKWLDKDDIKDWVKKETALMCTSVGVISYEDKKVVVLSASYDGRDFYGENMCIFKKDIIKREPLST